MSAFYKYLNKALDKLQCSDTLELEWTQPLTLQQVQALSYRLARRGRIDKVKTFKLQIQLNETQADECLNVIEQMLKDMKNVDGLFIANLRPSDCRRLCRACRTLARVAVGCQGVAANSCVTASTLLDLASPDRLEKLGLGYIRGDEMEGFAEAFSKMTKLEELSMGLGYGTDATTFNVLMQAIATNLTKSLKALYLWGPDAAEFKLTEHSLEGLTSVLRSNSQLGLLSLEDLPHLFSHEGRDSSALQPFCTALRTHTTLHELMLEGDLGLKEPCTVQVFEALEDNTSVKKIRLKSIPLSVRRGYESMMKSLSRNTHLKELFLRTTTQEDLDQVMLDRIVSDLHRNSGLTFFCTYIEELRNLDDDGNAQEWHICSNSSEQLEAVSERNSCIALTREAAPTAESFPIALLPQALERISDKGGGCHAAFPLIQNLAARLGEGLAVAAKSPAARSKKKRRLVCSAKHECFAVKRRSERLKGKSEA